MNLQIQKVIDRTLKETSNWTENSSKYSSDQIYRVFVYATLHKSSVKDTALHLQKLSGRYGSSPSTYGRFNNKK